MENEHTLTRMAEINCPTISMASYYYLGTLQSFCGEVMLPNVVIGGIRLKMPLKKEVRNLLLLRYFMEAVAMHLRNILCVNIF